MSPRLSLVAALFAVSSFNATAAVQQVTWDLRSGHASSSAFSSTGSGFGNVYTFTQDGKVVKVRAYGDGVRPNGTTGTSGTLYNAQLGRYDIGLGVCNGEEHSNCGNPSHQVDNTGRDDWVLFTFAEVVNFKSVVIDPYGTHDRDVTYWVGTAGSSAMPQILTTGLSGSTFASIISTFGAGQNVSSSASDNPLTVTLNGSGNFILFGAHRGGDDQDDYFKIKSVTVVAVPEPSTYLMLALGLVTLGGFTLRRRA